MREPNEVNNQDSAVLVLVVVLVTIVAGSISIRSAYADLQERPKRLTEQLAEEIEERLTNAWRQAGPRGVDRALHAWVEETRQPLLLEFVVFDSDDAELMPRVPRECLASIAAWPDLFFGQSGFQWRASPAHLPATRELGWGTGCPGAHATLAELDQQVRQLVWGDHLGIDGLGLLWTGSGLCRWCALGGAATECFDRNTRRRLGRAISRRRTQLKSGDELDQLAQSLNSMSQHLSDQQATIQRETQERMQAMEQLRHAERLGTWVAWLQAWLTNSAPR